MGNPFGAKELTELHYMQPLFWALSRQMDYVAMLSCLIGQQCLSGKSIDGMKRQIAVREDISYALLAP